MNLNNSLNLSSLIYPLLDHHHQLSSSHLQPSSSSSSSSSSSLSLHSFINPLQVQGQLQHHQQYGSHDHDHRPLTDNLNDISSLWKSENTQKRLPAKIRLTGRMLNSSWTSTTLPQAQKDNANVKKLEDTGANYNTKNIDSSTNPTRVCSDCNTTKTPLWRSGPRGPKSLCNACGIRQRKARRRAMAAAAANGSSESTKIITKVHSKEKTRSSNGHDQYLLPYNKRFRDDINNNDHHGINKGSRFEDFFISLSKKLAFHRVFPKDEEEAAILLMAISSGLVHG